jgi:urease accessory protein
VKEAPPTTSPDWLLLQLADSAFPTGSFAHSSGLEAAWQHKEVRNRDHLIEFLEAALKQCTHGTMPFVRASFAQPLKFESLDEHFDSFTANHVANRASRAQGRAFLTTVDRAFARPASRALRELVEARKLAAHFPIVFGHLLKALGFDLIASTRLFLFNHLRGLISSAVRLNIVGPLDGQTLQARLSPYAEALLASSVKIDLEHAAQTAPLLDFFQSTQDRLYSRLFQS